MRQFVRDDFQRCREAPKQFAITVAEDHLRAVPERIVVVASVMHGADQRHALGIDGIALEDLPVETIGRPQSFIGFVYGRIATRWLTFIAHQAPRQRLFIPGAVNSAVRAPGNGSCSVPLGCRRAALAKPVIGLERLLSTTT